MARAKEILTVGHSNHEEDAFLELLRAAGVEMLADVRAYPRSRHSHFNRSALAGSLEVAGIGYAHLGETLGGRRSPAPDSPNPAWENEQFRGYADHMASEKFARGLAELERLAAETRSGATSPASGYTAVMCAEAWWVRCHRRLIADALTVRGWRALHLHPAGSLTQHELTEFAVVEGDRITYPQRQTTLGV